MRCLSYTGICEGYKTSQKNRPRAPKRHLTVSKEMQRTLLPLQASYKDILVPTESKPEGRLQTIYPKATMMCKSISNGTGVKSPQEHRFFQLFQTKTAVELPGVFGGDLWKYLMMQASQKEAFVRDAAVAIGALSSCDRDLVTVRQDPEINNPQVVTKREEYQFALELYGKSVRQMRERLATGEEGMRSALIACLLVVCFEGLQGNYFQAMEHAVSGRNLLQEWWDRKRDFKGNAELRKEVIEDELVR